MKRKITVTMEIETSENLERQTERLKYILETSRMFFSVKVTHVMNEPIGNDTLIKDYTK